MNESIVTLTVYFEDPFWVGVIEKVENNKLSVCKITFGAEPKDSEILDFVLHRYYDLKFSPAVEVKRKLSADNPKRRQRNVKKQLQNTGVGTKAQQQSDGQDHCKPSFVHDFLPPSFIFLAQNSVLVLY